MESASATKAMRRKYNHKERFIWALGGARQRRKPMYYLLTQVPSNISVRDLEKETQKNHLYELSLDQISFL